MQVRREPSGRLAYQSDWAFQGLRPARSRKDIVIERYKSSYPSFRRSILLVMLGLCVFFWGFGYKLSLYDTHQPSRHRMPAAKLLSKNEDPSATDSIGICLASSVSSQVCLICSAFLLIFGLERRRRLFYYGIVRSREFPRPQLRFILSTFFFRPPPVPSVL